ncbi:hypothetical protein AgCh_011932 [Apium graveolens]
MATTVTSTNVGFKNLVETFMVNVKRAGRKALNVPLVSPISGATLRIEKVGNVAIRIELVDGSVGWGEAPILQPITAENQPLAMAKVADICEFLRNTPAMTLGLLLGEIVSIVLLKVRARVEMALIDAVSYIIGMPLWKVFGGVSNTIPFVSSLEAAQLASQHNKKGFKTLKLKVGKNLNGDIEVLQAIRAAHPDCLFILDANEGYTSAEAIQVLEMLHVMKLSPVLFEQPVHKDDWEGLGHVIRIAKEKYGVSVVADESCQSLADVEKIVEGNLVDVINIKLAKLGVLGALQIIELARASGLHLMIGGMVETRIAIGFAGHLAAGLGCFKFIDLDEPHHLSEDPVVEGCEVMKLSPVLFEQPVHKDDWEGLGHVTRIAKEKYGVSVVADESCQSLADVEKIVEGNLADVINIKLAKLGVLGALQIIELARASGLHLMIGGMVETRIAIGFTGHLAAGLGCFKFIDLDAPHHLSEDPVVEGCEDQIINWQVQRRHVFVGDDGDH